jgi:sulfatase modifying factor 1
LAANAYYTSSDAGCVTLNSMDQNQLNNLRNIAQGLHNLEASRIAKETATATNELLQSQKQQRALEQQKLAVEQQKLAVEQQRLQEEKRRTDLAAAEQERRRKQAEAEAAEKELQAGRVKSLRIEMAALEEEIGELNASLSNPETPPRNVSGVSCATYLFLLLQKKLGMLLSKKSSLHDLNDIRFLGQLEKSVGKLPKSFPALCGDGATSKGQQYLKELVDWPSRLVAREGTKVCLYQSLRKFHATTRSLLGNLIQADSEIHSAESIGSLLTEITEQEQSLNLVEAALISSWKIISPSLEELASIGLGIVEIRTLLGSGIPHLSECFVSVGRLRRGLGVCRQILREVEAFREQDLKSVKAAEEHLKAGELLHAYSTLDALKSRHWSDIGLEPVKEELAAAQNIELERFSAELDELAVKDSFAAVRQTEAKIAQFGPLEAMFSALDSMRTKLVSALKAKLLAEITQIEANHPHKALKHCESLLNQAESLPEVQVVLAEKKAAIGIHLKKKWMRTASVWMAIVSSFGLISFFDFLSGGQFGRLLGDQWSMRIYSLNIPGIVLGSSILGLLFLGYRDTRTQKYWKDLEDAANGDARKFREAAAELRGYVAQLKSALADKTTRTRTNVISAHISAGHIPAALAFLRCSVEFKHIPAGSFLMGSSDGSDESPSREVSVSSFLAATTAVTFGDWTAVIEWSNEQGYAFTNEGEGVSEKHPVTNVNWYDAVKWCNAKSEIEGLTPCYKINGAVFRIGEENSVTCDWDADGYRLPTEAEWEKSARGGLVGKMFPNGDWLDKKDAHFCETGPAEVGKYAANGYGLNDMEGNVVEWCWNWSEESHKFEVDDATGPAAGQHFRVARGGCWLFSADQCTVHINYKVEPENSIEFLGLRVVRRSGV